MPTVEARGPAAAQVDVEDLLALALARPAEALVAARSLLGARPEPLPASVAHQAAGIVLRDRGELPEALTELQAALACARLAGADQRIADVRATLGAALVMAGRTRRGLAELERAASVAQGQLLAKVRLRWAHVLYLLGRHDQALPLLHAAVSAFRRASDIRWEARTLQNRCMCYLAAGATQRAEADAVRAGTLFRSIGQYLEAAQAVHNRALAAHQAGNLPLALRRLAEAARDYQAIDVFSPDLAIDEAAVRLTAGLIDDAVDGLTDALATPHLQPVKRAELQLAAATAKLAQNLPNEAVPAKDLATAAAADFRRQRRAWWSGRAALVIVQARFTAGERSRDLVRTAAALADSYGPGYPQDAPFAHLLAGRLAAGQGDAALAEAHLSAAARSRRGGTPLVRATGWLAEALRWAEQGRPGRVLRACGHGLDALEEHQQTIGDVELRALATAHGRELSELALHAALPRGPRAVLRWAERWRATALTVPSVRDADHGGLGTELAALRDAIRRLETARAAGRPTGQLERQRQAREVTLRRRQRHLPGEGGPPRRVPVDTLLAALGTATLVELVVVDGSLHAVIARQGRVRRVAVGPVASAEQEVDFARFGLRRAAHGRVPPLAGLGRQLQEALLGPASRALPDDTTAVILVPPGRLHAVPWGLLPTLGQRPVTVAPSAAAWLRARGARPPAQRRVALVAGPDLGTGGAEVPQLAARYVGASVLRDGRANTDQVLAALDGAWLGHIAAHGVFRADSPLFSSLRLDDGPLMVHDLERLGRAPYRLVLSACDTGVAAAVGADEVLGMVSGLLAVGTASVVASVTPVNDEATVPVMLALHDALDAGADPAAALLAARSAVAGDPVAEATAASFLALGG